MKQYTSKDQTAKLIELGFPKPQGWGNKGISNGISIALYKDGREDFNYSIGELIEFLPKRIDSGLIDLFFGRTEWFIRYEDRRNMPQLTLKQWQSKELIDALFKTCVTLKEEGVI